MPLATALAEDAPDITGIKGEHEVIVAQNTSKWNDLKYRNVILLGLSFMGLFSAFQTCGLVQTIVLQNYFGQEASTLGYVSLGILYATLGCANWFSPFLISILNGPKWAMIFGGITYSLFIAVFLRPYYATLYAGSVLVGVGAAVLWTAQGVFLTVNSDKHTMARNSGLFWALFQSSYVPGNLFFFFYLNGETKIEDSQRTVLYTVLLAVSLVGIAVMFFFKHPIVAPVAEEALPVTRRSSTEVQVRSARGNPFPAMVAAFRLWKGRDMIFLSFTFAYTGFAQTFFGGVYGTCLGYTAQFGETRKSVVGLSGVAIGLGEILGGLAFGIMGKKTIRYGRDPIVLFGYFLHLCTYFLIYLNIPEDAPLRETDASSYLTPSLYLGVFCYFLLGLGDASFNTQVYSLLGSVFRNDSASAFALFKFVQSFCAAGGYYYSAYLILPFQLLILVIVGFFGTFAFFFVEWKHAFDDTVVKRGSL